MITNWLTETLQKAVDNNHPILWLPNTSRGAAIRVYDRATRNTKFTFYLDDYTNAIQDAAVDTIYPVIS